MKSAARALYLVGRIFNVINMVVCALGIVLGGLVIGLKEDILKAAIEAGNTKLDSLKEVEAAGVVIIVSCAIALVVTVAVFILAQYASKKLKEDSKETVPHVIMLIIGVFGDIFYFIGGIFGLVSVEQPDPAK